MTLLLYRLIFVVTLLIDNDIAIIQTDFVVTLLIDNDIAIIQTDFCSDFINW